MHYGDMTDATNLIRIVQETQPTEIYNLAAQSHVMVSFETPNTPPMPTPSARLRLLEAIRILKLEQRVRFYQARPRSCSARRARRRRAKPRRSIRAAPTRPPSSTPTGSR